MAKLTTYDCQGNEDDLIDDVSEVRIKLPIETFMQVRDYLICIFRTSNLILSVYLPFQVTFSNWLIIDEENSKENNI